MMDTELGPEERALIASVRGTHEPTDLQRQRVRKSLDAKLAAGVTLALTIASPALAAGLKVAGAIVGVAVVAGTAYYVPRHLHSAKAPSATPAVRTAAPVRASRPSPVAEPAPSEPSAGAVPPAAAEPPAKMPARRHEPVPRPADTTLSAELALLSEANAAVERGDAGKAQEILRDYDRRFRAGVLAQERAGTGVLALCAAGRLQEARAAAARFLSRWPRSPLVARIKDSCAGK